MYLPGGTAADHLPVELVFTVRSTGVPSVVVPFTSTLMPPRPPREQVVLPQLTPYTVPEIPGGRENRYPCIIESGPIAMPTNEPLSASA